MGGLQTRHPTGSLAVSICLLVLPPEAFSALVLGSSVIKKGGCRAWHPSPRSSCSHTVGCAGPQLGLLIPGISSHPLCLLLSTASPWLFPSWGFSHSCFGLLYYCLPSLPLPSRMRVGPCWTHSLNPQNTEQAPQRAATWHVFPDRSSAHVPDVHPRLPSGPSCFLLLRCRHHPIPPPPHCLPGNLVFTVSSRLTLNITSL